MEAVKDGSAIGIKEQVAIAVANDRGAFHGGHSPIFKDGWGGGIEGETGKIAKVPYISLLAFKCDARKKAAQKNNKIYTESSRWHD